MNGNKRKLITLQMIQFELRNVVGNPYVHIFGIGLPIFLAGLTSKIAASELADPSMIPMTSTAVYLGMGALIPMAAILMGYSVSYAQELDKGIPQRMQLFGIKNSISLSNRAISEMLFIFVSFILFFLSGILITDLKRPTATGLISYTICMLILSLIFLVLAHGIACICRNFGLTYCVSMMTYFAFMILGGMMGISCEDLPKWAQILAKLLPITYINQDFYQIWRGETYNYMPMIQSFLFLGAAAGIILFISLKKTPGSRK